MTDREAMQMALEALQCSLPFHETVQRLGAHNKAITALRAALEQPQRKPLTTEDRSSIVNEALRGHASTRDAIDWAIRHVERHHGIGEKP